MQPDIVWLQFLALTLIIVYAGIKLSRYADYIATHTKLGRLWVGVILLAVATSLPEIVNGISASMRALPDLVLGDVLGSCVFNLLLIAIIDIYYKPAPVLTKADKGHLVSAGFGIWMLFLVGYSFTMDKLTIAPSFFNIGLYTPFIFISYVVAVRIIYLFQKKRIISEVKELAKPVKVSLSKAYLLFSIFAGMIIFAGVFLPVVGASIAKSTGWNQSFVGTLFIALTTSLPELVVSITAIRIKAIDLALGNILGSNLINIAVIGVADIFYTKGSILQGASSAHILTVYAAIAMYSIVVISVIYESNVKRLRVTATTIILLSIYLLNTYLIFKA